MGAHPIDPFSTKRTPSPPLWQISVMVVGSHRLNKSLAPSVSLILFSLGLSSSTSLYCCSILPLPHCWQSFHAKVDLELLLPRYIALLLLIMEPSFILAMSAISILLSGAVLLMWPWNMTLGHLCACCDGMMSDN